ncbi:MAG: BrnA antitoxin family protein [Deltaproteobacteria bacterium]|nr:BrnA antitoxin family protein [Deltaproteobacteria bacterium]
MKKVAAEKYRDIDFSRAKRGPVVKPEPGKTKISIRLDNTVLEYFRDLVDKAGGGNYQTLINDALLEHVHRRSTLDVVRQVVREELAPYGVRRGLTSRSGGAGARVARTPAAHRER